MARILIVDDSPTEIYVLKLMLIKEGYEIATAKSGEEGIRVAKTQKPDLILMDVVMPGMNGFQATRELSHAEETENIPIIIVTTKDQQTDRVWATRQGAKDYLVKPVIEDELVKSVKRYLSP
ncbi:MAG: response regulator [Pseudomonadota bacterium]